LLPEAEGLSPIPHKCSCTTLRPSPQDGNLIGTPIYIIEAAGGCVIVQQSNDLAIFITKWVIETCTSI